MNTGSMIVTTNSTDFSIMHTACTGFSGMSVHSTGFSIVNTGLSVLSRDIIHVLEVKVQTDALG